MKRLIFIAALFFFSIPAFGQGSRFNGIITNQAGLPVPAATVYICTLAATGTPCSPTVPIYSDAGLTTPVANPITTDNYGRYGFWITPGNYLQQVSGFGITTYTQPISVGGVGVSNISINGSLSSSLNFNNTIPASAIGYSNVLFQLSGSSVSAEAVLSLGNGKTVCDLTGPACSGTVLPVTSDFAVLANSCLAIANGQTCDGRGFSGTVTGSGPITTSKYGGVLMLPAGPINLTSGIVGWAGGHVYGIGLSGQMTVVNVASGDCTYSSGLVGGFEADHYQCIAPTGQYGFNIQSTQGNFHDIAGNGGLGGFRLANNSCACFGVGDNVSGYATDPNGIGFSIGGAAGNDNHFGYVSAGCASTAGTCQPWQISGYNNQIDHLTVEKNGAFKGGEITGGSKNNRIGLQDYENDNPPQGDNTWLNTIDSGAVGNYIGGANACIDNSGNNTNTCGSTTAHPQQHRVAGSWVVTQIPNLTVSVTPKTSYYGKAPAGYVAGTNLFSSSSWTTEGWVYPTLSSYPSWPIQTQYQAYSGGDAVVVYMNYASSTTFTPQLEICIPGCTSVFDTQTLAAQAWSLISVSYNSGTGKATIYVNGVSGSGAQTIHAANNDSYILNVAAYNATGNNFQQFVGQEAYLGFYGTALSSGNIGNHYTHGSSGTGYAAYITGSTDGGPPTYMYPLNDTVSTIAITSVDTSVAGVATYHASSVPANFCGFNIPPNINEFPNVTFTGFVAHASNNGQFSCQSSTSTTLVMVNANAIAETVSATGSYPNVMTESIAANNGQYQGPAVVNSVAGIPGDTTGTGKAAQFGGNTLYSYNVWGCDYNGLCTAPSATVYAANFATLNTSSYNSLGPAAGPQGIQKFWISKNGTSNCLVNPYYLDQFPYLDNGGSTLACSPAAPSRNATGDLVPSVAGTQNIGSAALPLGSLYLGTAATNNAILTPAAFGQATTYTVPDPGTASVSANGLGISVEDCGVTSGATQNCAKTVKYGGIAVRGQVTLNGAATQAITTLPFTSSSSYSCWGSDFTNAAGIVSFSVYTSGAAATIKESGGGTSDVLYWACLGF